MLCASILACNIALQSHFVGVKNCAKSIILRRIEVTSGLATSSSYIKNHSFKMALTRLRHCFERLHNFTLRKASDVCGKW